MSTLDVNVFIEAPSLDQALAAVRTAVNGMVEATPSTSPDSLVLEFDDPKLAPLNAYQPLLVSSDSRIAYGDVVDLARYAFAVGFVDEFPEGPVDTRVAALARGIGEQIPVLVAAFPDEEDPYLVSLEA